MKRVKQEIIPRVRAAACILVLFFPVVASSAAAELPRSILLEDARTQETFFDGLMPGLLSAHKIPGAVVSVVRGDELVFSKGWGLAEVESRRPMTPDTRMRVASISKLITATAALQLVERGKLDLHADIHEILDFQIESAFDEPVTLHHLLTHTGGFDDRMFNTVEPHGASATDLGDYLRRRMPRVVMPPGQTLSYSNHGLALVGRLVELASGQSFGDYVQAHIFDPLEMHSSRFGVPYPVASNQAHPYSWQNGLFREFWFERWKLAPAAELDTTARDIANFAIAHLNQGRFRDFQLLRPETIELMHAQQFSHDERLPGWAYGFAQTHYGGASGLGHQGWVIGFHSQFHIYPDRGTAVFVSYNGEPTGPVHKVFSDGLRSWGQVEAPAKPRAKAELAGDAEAWAGSYLPSRRYRGDFGRLLGLASVVNAVPDGEGGFVLSGPFLMPVRWTLEAPDLARHDDGVSLALLRNDPATNNPQLILGNLAYDRISGFSSPRLHSIVWLLAMLLGLSTLLGWCLGALVRRFFGAAASPVSSRVRWLGSGVSLLMVALPLGIASFITSTPAVLHLMLEIPAGLRLVLWLPFLLFGLCVALTLSIARAVSKEARAPLQRLHLYILLGFSWALLGSAWFLHIRGPWSL